MRTARGMVESRLSRHVKISQQIPRCRGPAKARGSERTCISTTHLCRDDVTDHPNAIQMDATTVRLIAVHNPLAWFPQRRLVPDHHPPSPSRFPCIVRPIFGPVQRR
jgi:hypothetical protein